MDSELATQSEMSAVPQSASTAVESNRAIASIQAAVLMARKFPREQTVCWNKIMSACKRKALADTAVYEYPQGGQMVSGPSIRLAEVIAQCWGNLDYGIKELSQENGASELDSYCWDLETNVRKSITFKVKHERHSKKGVKSLTDPRDIYETIANVGTRRMRNAILAVIPRDVVEAALAQCEKTMAGTGEGPIQDRIRAMAQAFEENFQVTVAMIEARLKHKIDATTERELIAMRKIYNSLKDGMADRSQFFDVDPTQAGDAAALNQRFSGKTPEAEKQ